MKWQQRVRVATGLSCWQIMLHLLVVALKHQHHHYRDTIQCA